MLFIGRPGTVAVTRAGTVGPGGSGRTKRVIRESEEQQKVTTVQRRNAEQGSPEVSSTWLALPTGPEEGKK